MSSPGVIGIENLKQDLEDLKKAELTIGYQGLSGKRPHPNGGGASVAEVASYMEFGTRTIPARPFLRVALKQHRSEIIKAMKKALSSIIDQRAGVDAGIKRVGESAVQAVRETIDRSTSWAAPLAASTVAAKGSSTPLIDSGFMRDNASWAQRDSSGRIVKQGGERA